jgi:hypothetical protein
LLKVKDAACEAVQLNQRFMHTTLPTQEVPTQTGTNPACLANQSSNTWQEQPDVNTSCKPFQETGNVAEAMQQQTP